MEPIRQSNRPSLVVHLVHEGAIFGRDAKGGDARHPIGVGCGVQGTGGAGTGADGGEVGGRNVGGASGGRGGCECLVESLANHFRCAYACMYVGVCGANPYIIIHDPNNTQTDMMTLPGGQGHGHRIPYTVRTTVVPFRTTVPCRGQILWVTRTTMIGCVPTTTPLWSAPPTQATAHKPTHLDRFQGQGRLGVEIMVSETNGVIG